MDPEAHAVIMAGEMCWACTIIRFTEHFVLDLGRHSSSGPGNSRWDLNNWRADIILIAAWLAHWMRGRSHRFPRLLLASSCNVGLVNSSIRTCWSGSLLLRCILSAFRGWVPVSCRVANTDSNLLPLLRPHSCGRRLKLVWSTIWLLFPQSWVIQHRCFELFLLLLLLFLMALSISGQTRILPWVHHFSQNNYF